MRPASAIAFAMVLAIPILGSCFGIVFLMFAGIGAVIDVFRFRDRLSISKLIAFMLALPAAGFAWYLGYRLGELAGAHIAVTLVFWLYLLVYVRYVNDRAGIGRSDHGGYKEG